MIRFAFQIEGKRAFGEWHEDTLNNRTRLDGWINRFNEYFGANTAWIEEKEIL